MHSLISERVLMRVHVSESARHGGVPMYRAIANELQRLDYAGATVLAAIMSFDAYHDAHDRHSEYSGHDTPVVIECIETAARSTAVLPLLASMLTTGMITLERATVMLYRAVPPAVPTPLPARPTAFDVRAQHPSSREDVQMQGALGDRVLMRIHVGGDDRVDGRPLFEAIVELLRHRELAGATVFRGVLGFGAHAQIHRDKTFALSNDLPYVIECVDTHEKLDAVMPELDQMIGGGVITLEQVKVVLYRSGESPPASATT